MKILKLAAAAAVLALGTSAFADEAYDVIKKFTELKVPDTSQATMYLHNIEKSGATETRLMNQYGHEKGGGLVETVFDFRSPASVKDTRVLQSEKSGREDERWIYMPSLRQVRRIPMGERYKQFVGCEFTYNDMAIRDVDADTHEMLNNADKVTVAGTSYDVWKIKSVPKKKSEVEYSYRIQYIDKVSYLPVKIEYFDKKDQTKLMKTYTTEEIIYITAPKTGTKYTMRMKARIVNNITGRQTYLEIKDPKFDEGISPAYFTQQYLSTGKAK